MTVQLKGGLLTKVGVLSAASIVLLGLVLGQTLKTMVRDRALENASQAASVAATLAIKPKITRSDLSEGLSAARVRDLDRLLQASGLLGQDIVRVKIWNTEGEIVYSDDHTFIGRRFPIGHDLEEALEGEIEAEVSELDDAENADVRSYDQLLEVYVPLEFGDADPVGVFEIYLPYAPIRDAMGQDTRRIQMLLGAGLALLWLALLRIVGTASRTLRRQARENEHLALHDPLTDLPNRTLFHDRLQQVLLAGKRAGSMAGVIVLDLDRFKEVNDTLGHGTGDELLKQLGTRLGHVLREVDTIARLGGDEFGVLLPSLSDATAAEDVAVRILAGLDEPFAVGGLRLQMEASLGIAIFPECGHDAELLLQRAEVAMYVAKEQKTRFRVYSADIDAYDPERLTLLGELRRAITEDELVLHYQPEVDIVTGEVVEVEALLRWQHPTKGLLGPDQFIPLAEATELIGPMTRKVLDGALAQCRRWLDEGIDLGVAVNISARNLHHQDLPAQVVELLGKWGVAPGRLKLEITESAVMADPVRAMTILRKLRTAGVQLALDDFGTGYSSLSYLKRLPVHDLKIDKSFVMNMHRDDNDLVIVRSTIDLGRNLGLRVVAEGVETAEALSELERLGCDVAQGYLLSRPVPADQLTDWILTRRAGSFGLHEPGM